MLRTWNHFTFTLLLLCTFYAIINCSLSSNKTSSSESENTAVPQFRSKSIEASKETLVVQVGDTIRRKCSVTGNPKPTVSFYKDDKILREDSRIRIEHNALRISPAKLTDSGKYKCVALSGQANTSLNFTVVVEDIDQPDDSEKDSVSSSKGDSAGECQPPQWTHPERMKKKLHAEPAGNTVRFSCRVEGNPVPTVEWFKFYDPIDKGGRVGGYRVRTIGLLILESAVPADDGMYTCKATNDCGSINHTYELDVQERAASRPLLQFGLPKNQTAYIGDNVTFRCVVFSDPHPHVKWVRHIQINGSWVDPKTNKKRTAAKPFMAEGILKNETVYLGDNVTFKCKVFSDAHPHIEWIRSKPKRDSNKTDIKVLKSAGLNTTDSDMEVLLLKNVSYEDAGEYTCLAGNSIGISHQSAWLKVLPEPPTTSAGAIPLLDGSETTNLIYGMVGVLAIIVVIGISLFLYYNYYNGKDPPMLVPIKNPDNIPPMTKIEIPTMMYGNNEAWRRMCLPVHDQFDFNIPPDLQWELRREDIGLTEKLDEGFFGLVFKAELKTRNETAVCAVKILKASRTEKDVLDLLSEMDQMKRVGKHKNIINLLGVCTQNGPYMLVTEYASEGNLREFLRRNRPQNMHCNLVMPTDIPNPQPENLPPQDRLLSQKDLVSFAFQVSRGMDYLAQKKCIHRDLAARNVLVTDDRVMKIADFGLARDIRSCDYYRKHTRGHLPYKWMALEAMADNVFTHATDVWSFGVLLWEIFSLAGTPYPGIKTGELVKFLRSGERLEKPNFATQEMYMLMRDCWEDDPRRRPNFRSLVEDLERMLAEASNDEFISDYDAMADYDDDSAEESEETDEDDDDDDDVFVPTENSDSISDGNIPFNEERDSFTGDAYARPLLENTSEGVMRNQHARLQSDV